MTEGQRDWGQFVLLLIDAQRDFWTEQVDPLNDEGKDPCRAR